MIRFERTNDPAQIRQAIANPRTYRWHCCDGSPSIEDYQPILDPAIWYVAVYDGDEWLGIFMFVPQNPILWEVHTCLLPSAWGQRAADAAKGCAKWVFANTTCRHIITHVPSDNKLALHFAHDAGFAVYGSIPASFPRDGHILGQVLLGKVA